MSLLRKASIVTTPTAYENGKILSVKPSIVLGNELITNGDFATDSDWTLQSGWSIGDGKATFENSQGAGNLTQTSVLEVGKYYKLTFDTLETNNTTFAYSFGSGFEFISSIGPNSTHTVFGTAAGTSINLRGTSLFSGSITNVSVKEVLDSDFDFTRNSSATRVNSQGLIEDMQILSGDLVSNGDFSQEGSELLTNGDFATDSDWTKSGGATISNGMANFLTGSSKIAQSISAPTQDRVYRVEFDSNQINLSTTAVLIYGSGFYGSSNIPSVGKNILYIKTNISGGSQTNKIQLTGGSNGTLDNVSVKEVGQDWTLEPGWSIGEDKAIATGASNSNLEQVGLTISNTKKYKISFTVDNYTSGAVRPMLGAVGAVAGTYVSENGTFTETLTANNNFDRIVFRTSGSGTTLSISNISIIEITDDTNLPRIDYTGGEGHWLFEPQSTNLVTYSEDFSQWGQSGAPALTSGQLAPDGTFGATKISGTIGSSYIALAQASTTTATRTIYAKTVSGTGTAKLMSYSGNTNNLFTLTEEWQRFELTGSSAVGATSFYIDLRDNAQTLSEFIIWGAQSEELSFATSYIPTNGSQITRLADAAFGAGSSDLINSTEGVLYAEISALANENLQRWFSLSNGTTSNTVKIGLLNNTTDYRFACEVRSAAVLSAFMTYNFGAVTPTFVKVAFKYSLNDFALWVNGVEVATDTSGNTPIGLNKLSFNRADGAQTFYGKTKNLKVFTTALTDEQLAALTTI